MSKSNALSLVDVQQLLADPSPENRSIAAEKVSDVFASPDVTQTERGLAEEIFRVMLGDAAVRVRKALSEGLMQQDSLPHDIAISLSKDVDDVALPMIQNSAVLNESDLLEIVETRGEGMQKAVAMRADVTEKISSALVDTANENVIVALVSNNDAKISDVTFDKVITNHGGNPDISNNMALRDELPINVAERLVSLVTDQLRDHIMTHHKISASLATDLLLEAREKATVSLLDGNNVSTDVKALVEQLHSNGRLTPTLVIRALCTGDTTFFETAISVMCQIPMVNAYKIIHDGGEMGMIKAFEKAGIPLQFVKLSRVALDTIEEMTFVGGDDRDQFRQVVMERVLTHFEDLENQMDGESIDYLIGKLKTVDMSHHAA